MTRYELQRIKAARERGRKMAAARWRIERMRRDQLAALSPEYYPGRILRRIVVIEEERTVREVILRESDSDREARRKIKWVLTRSDQTDQAEIWGQKHKIPTSYFCPIFLPAQCSCDDPKRA